MSFDCFVSRKVFKAIQTLDIDELSQCSPKDLRPVLPCLARASLICPTDITLECSSRRTEILTLVSAMELITPIVELLAVDFTTLEQDIRHELHMRLKVVNTQGDSRLHMEPSENIGLLALQFERSSSTRRLQFVLNELLFISSLHQKYGFQDAGSYAKRIDLFDYDVYLPEICDVISVALLELPLLLTVQDAIEALLYVNHGPAIICWVVANLSETFNEVCTFLMTTAKQYQDKDNDDENVQVRMHTLCLLCHMNPSQTLTVLNKCVEMLIMPALAVKLNLVYFASQGEDGIDHILAFVSGLLLGNNKKVRNWFAVFLHKCSQKQNHPYSLLIQALRVKLLDHVKNMLTDSLSGIILADVSVVRASSMIRFYCALYGIANIKFQDEEVLHIVQLITSHPPVSSASVRFLSLGLCMLVACPSLLSIKEHEAKCIQWLKWLIHEDGYFKNKTSFGQMLILMAIHFHSNQVTAISDLVCSTLGMKIPIRQNNIIRLKQIFIQEIFSESMITSHAVKVPVTTNLSANILGFLPVHCIYQLLKNRAFMKHKVSIKKWIFKQLCSSVVPLHPVLPALIEVYVNFVLAHDSKAPQNNRQCIEVKDVRKVFKDTFACEAPLSSRKISYSTDIPSLLTSQLLLLYYLLCYEDVRLKQFSSFEHVQVYSTEFLSELPVKYLVCQAQYYKQNYTGLFIPLLKLLVSHFPHLSLVDDWFTDEIDESVLIKPTPEETCSVLKESDIVDCFKAVKICPYQTESVLYKMLSTSPALLWPHADITLQQIPKVIDSHVPRHIQELFRLVWLRLNNIRPRYIQAKTWRYLAYHNDNDVLALANCCILDHTTSSDPLVPLINCDSRVFRCPPILEVLLRVLQASLVASRSQLFQHKERIRHRGEILSDNEIESLYNAIVATQESIAVQTLLEVCLETAEDKINPGQLWTLQEVRSIICSYIHQVFIGDPSLAKLVHFQGYASGLLSAVTVPGIPSMHICLDFIPELLSQPELEKQVFAVDLISHLSLQYALPKSMSTARLAVNTLSTLINVLSAEVRTTMFIVCIPALVRICEAFPSLFEDVLGLLVQLGYICLSFSCIAPDGNNRSAKLTNFRKFKFDPKGDLALQNDFLIGEIQRTFDQILKHAVFKSKIY